ncbi:MAG TPA: histidine kinase [Candidatus Dormibacteraeota bacterium]|nr:histidine kinase [Candidatus Dormibacteraeota bacterium]
MADTDTAEAGSDAGDRAGAVSMSSPDGSADVRRSRARILLAADGDRRAIERALHDGLQQQLVALAAGLRQVRALIEADPLAATARLDDLSALSSDAIDEAARLAQWIHPPRLHEPRALPGALRGVAARLGITVEVDISTSAVHPPETFARLYWCCSEALALAPPGTLATVNVRDRVGGLGFEVGVADRYVDERSERLRDRVEALGGSVTVEATDAGSRIAGLIPPP